MAASPMRPAAPGQQPVGLLPAGEHEVPDAVLPPPGHPRFPLFDSVRAFAVISIVIVHAAHMSGYLGDEAGPRLVARLDIGVALFFLLSGFLLYRPLIASRVLGARSVRLRDYARRRFLRIAPAYWVALTALAIFPGMAGVFTGNWWVYYGLLQDFPVYDPSSDCVAQPFNCGIAPAWSLAVEVGFYVLLPFFAMGMAALYRRHRGRNWLRWEFVVLAALSICSVAIIWQGPTSDLLTWLFFSPFGRAWWFALGMGLAALSVRFEQDGVPDALARLAPRVSLLWVAAIVVYMLTTLYWLPPHPTLTGRFELSQFDFAAIYVMLGVIATLILVPAIVGGGFAQRVLAHPILAWLGLISYGIFLWHFPVLYALVEGGVLDWWPSLSFPVLAVTGFAITICCAALSYYLVERPLMRFKYRS